jgi:hypothetical protein
MLFWVLGILNTRQGLRIYDRGSAERRSQLTSPARRHDKPPLHRFGNARWGLPCCSGHCNHHRRHQILDYPDYKRSLRGERR